MSNCPAFWHRPSVVGYLLSPLSLLYWAVARMRASRLEENIMPIPVVCVGNNTVGGSGKTPAVIAIAEILKQQGKNPHVISRGYKGSYAGTIRVDVAKHRAHEVGDEPLLIARTAPCWVARKRVDAALAAIAEGADCIIMDDGMQNPTIKKTITVMVVDGGYGFGNKQMLPAGPCREPISVSLHKANIVLVMGEATNPDAQSISSAHPNAFTAELIPSEETDLSGQKLLAFAGIGRPGKFFDTLQNIGAKLVDTASFPDHHSYTEAELQKLSSRAQEQNAALMTTEKDWLRLPDEWREKVGRLPVKAVLDNCDAFSAYLQQAVAGVA